MKQTLIPWKRSNSVEDIKHRAWWRGFVIALLMRAGLEMITKIALGHWFEAWGNMLFITVCVLSLWYYQDRKPDEIVWYVSSEVDGDYTADNMEHVMSKEDEDGK